MRLLLLISMATAQEMEPRIVGGSSAEIKDWSFIALTTIFSKNTAITCGGSLLSSQTILTAAHCLDDVTDSKKNFEDYTFSVLMGHAVFSKSTMIRFVMDYRTHENYQEDSTHHDIGLMFLWKPVTFSDTVQKVLLLRTLNIRTDRMCMVAGWGAWSTKLNETHMNSPYLKSLGQTLMEDQLCQDLLEEDPMDGVVCAEDPEKNQFPYSGDSGGPLVLSGQPIQVGIVSFRVETHRVTVYTSVPYYYKWIEHAQWQLFQQHCPREKKKLNYLQALNYQEAIDLNIYDGD